MLAGPLLPLDSAQPLFEVLQLASRPEPGRLGAWVRNSRQILYLHESAGGSGCVVISADLGFLLQRCDRVALRGDGGLVVLEVEEIIRWRSLQVVTSTPYLARFLIPLSSTTPEEILAQLIARGVGVAESRVTYLSPGPEGSVPAGLFGWI